MLSVILPVRNWPAERIEGCARSFLRLKSETLRELLIVDFGSDEPVVSSIRDSRLKIIRSEAEVWSLAEAINVGVLNAKGTVLAKTDADIIVAPEAGPDLDRAVHTVLSGRIGLALSQATDLPQGIHVDAALDTTSDELDSAGRLRPRWGQGGLAIFTRETWDAIGGFDSRFTGWGNEDNDFAERVRRSGRKVRWLERDAVRIYHIWHPPSFYGKGVVARRVANIELARKDRSVFRPLRILHSQSPGGQGGNRQQKPGVAKSTAPLVTIAIASAERKNRMRMLKEAIRSYVGQIGNDMEIVVADNGSTEAEYAQLCEELGRMKLPVPLRPIRVAQPSIPAARNAITDVAAGRYVCVADDDDIALPNRLADHLACFEKNPTIHGSHGGWIDFDELTGVIEVNEGKERSLATLLFGTGKITAHPTCFYRTDVLRQIRYDEALTLGSDLDLALRMANAGLKIEHTNSFVTLRRFHAANVTVTGLSNQVTNGEKSRRRLKDSLGPALCEELAAKAKDSDQAAYCRNKIDHQRIVGMLPKYAGVWRLHFPLSALPQAASSPLSAASIPPIDAIRLPERPMPGAGSGDLVSETAPLVVPDQNAIQRVLEIVDGDIASVGSGINLGFAYVSRPLRGAAKAVRAKQSLAELGIEAEITAEHDFIERRGRGFTWSHLKVPKGARRLLSEPIADPLAVTQLLASFPASSVLRGMLSVIADGNQNGIRYHLVTGPLQGRDSAQSTAMALSKHSPVPFALVSNGGVACDF